MPEDVYGPSVPYREYSFLQKQEAAPLNASVLTIEVCAEESAADCADGSGPAAEAGGVVKLRPGLDDAQLKAALATVAKPFKVRLRRATRLLGRQRGGLLLGCQGRAGEDKGGLLLGEVQRLLEPEVPGVFFLWQCCSDVTRALSLCAAAPAARSW